MGWLDNSEENSTMKSTGHKIITRRGSSTTMSPNPNMTSSRPKNSFARWLKGEYEQSPQAPVGMGHLEANTRHAANPGLRTTSSGNTERFTRPVRVREQSGGPLRQWMTGSLPVDVIEPVVVERYHTESRAGGIDNPTISFTVNQRTKIHSPRARSSFGRYFQPMDEWNAPCGYHE